MPTLTACSRPSGECILEVDFRVLWGRGHSELAHAKGLERVVLKSYDLNEQDGTGDMGPPSLSARALATSCLHSEQAVG